MNPDDERLAELFRTLRHQASLTQEQLAEAASIPVRDVRRLEAGEASKILLGRVRSLFAELDARTRLNVWWKGAAADRLLDQVHASIGERASRFMSRYGWKTPMELTFSEFGERGSVDIFAHHRSYRAVAVCEVKSVFGSLEELNRTLDVKVRLAPKLCRDRFGWTPTIVGRLLVVPDRSTNRRVVAAHEQTMAAIYDARGREI